MPKGGLYSIRLPFFLEHDRFSLNSSNITQLYTREQNNPELLHQAAQLEALSESWRDYFQEQSLRQDVK
ncbi:3-alpha domain-containing protein [Nostoc punctiforme UO1]|uniref:3-alpha domain-containing protein n=1 Tax=Nostoc punctiforme TaxID=272131 RepID=UPI0030AF0D9D